MMGVLWFSGSRTAFGNPLANGETYAETQEQTLPAGSSVYMVVAACSRTSALWPCAFSSDSTCGTACGGWSDVYSTLIPGYVALNAAVMLANCTAVGLPYTTTLPSSRA